MLVLYWRNEHSRSYTTATAAAAAMNK